MLEIKNLQVSINNKLILKGLNLSIKPGELHAIMGPNGSGKSTLANVLSGKSGYKISGKLNFEGKNLKEIPIEDGSLDMLLMGEFIEHIEESHKVMSDFARKMQPSGICYFSTAANAPAEDHILLFKNTAEIKDFIMGNGWTIQKDQCFTINDISLEKAEAEGLSINYVAILAAR